MSDVKVKLSVDIFEHGLLNPMSNTIYFKYTVSRSKNIELIDFRLFDYKLFNSLS